MSNSIVISESGTIKFGDKFMSVSLIKQSLKKYNRISVLEESSDFIKCKVFRIARIFGGPWLGPYPIVSFRIERNQNETLLHYNHYWPEYYLTTISSVVIGVTIGVLSYIKIGNILAGAEHGIMFSSIAIIITSTCIYLDVAYYKRLLRKELIKQ